MKKGKLIMISTLLATGIVCSLNAETNAKVNADFLKPKTEVSKNLFGIFYEDINYAADGGLYAEMVQNRSFEFRASKRLPTDTWYNVNINGTKAKSRVKGSKTNPLNEKNTTFATLDVKQAGDGIANKGYGGMYFEKGKTYPGSVYIRSTDASVSSITISAGDIKAGSKSYITKIEGIGKEWKKFTFNIVPVETTTSGQIALCADTVGTVDFDFVSLFRADIYKNEPNGLREDLAKKLEELHPAFIRFPGGCIVQGSYMSDRYQWKNSIGPVEERTENFNFWNYQQSLGLGFYEYFRLCEDLNAEPIPILNCGISWQGENNNDADVPMSKMDPYVQDALDLIEYATGSATSEWGKKRAEAGHPEPFKLNYLGIGNEDGRQHYWERYELIAKAVKAKYPNIKLIISAGAFPSDQTFHDTWSKVRNWEKKDATSDIVNLVDEHYYSPSSWFLTNQNRYEDLSFYPRGKDEPKVFIGEYASWDDNKRNSLYAAITEAAYMTSIEKNGDIVEIASYAPLFAFEGKSQWAPDMIWFNNHDVYLSPNYYVQQLFMTHKSDRTISSTLVQPTEKNSEVKGIGGTVGIGTWATSAQFKDIAVTDNDSGKVIYDSNKSTGNITDFTESTGDWSNDGSVILQNDANGTPAFASLDNADKVQNIKNYTYNLKAMKTSGAEGFLISFGIKGKNLYWWNMGGWGNTQSVIEKGTLAGRTTIGTSQALTLNNGTWYDIKIEVTGDSYKCYLDGLLMHEDRDAMSFDPIYTHVGETDSGKIYVKIVNISEKEQKVDINLTGSPALSSTGTAVYITGKPTDENSFKNPTVVASVKETVKNISSSFAYTVKPSSVTIIEIDEVK